MKFVAVFLIVVLGVLLGFGFAALRAGKDFIAHAIERKLDGELPELTWGQVFSGMPGNNYQAPWMSWVRSAKVDEGPCPALFDTPVGSFWARPDDGPLIDFLLKEQLIHSAYFWGPVTVRPGDIVLDVGGHIGTFSRLAFRQGADKVIAFEPEPTNIACLKKNFASEIESGRYVVIEAAAWESEGDLHFAVPHDVAGYVDAEGELSVKAVTLDAVADELRLERVDFIKMDIEGAERHALAGARRILETYAPRMALCTYHRADDPIVIPETVKSLQSAYARIDRSDQVYFYKP